ncbi:CPBP family intramembrane glutamic endopeptidase [Paenibacillus sp. NFR01]|uniref:CPBP family intramembrane glutamic endopeptidase n=1 Tax=Paenibacillus sp. NFR01 TaxID=1566279 RepID=UPI0008BB9D4A|nr:CPBP family intramembrane glutamic endopeptidase [Paenibacillus sp. NFR01]SEU28342.1 hypothetical protein SAMN03159358_4692 [Paenibacillus sp. NFR01]
MNTVKTKKEHPVWFSLMMGIVLTLAVSVASAVGSMLELNDNGMMLAQAGGFAAMAIVVAVYMRSGGKSLSRFGFHRPGAGVRGQALYYLPLAIIALTQPVFSGIDPELTGARIAIIVLFTLLVGYTEESVFRGIIRDKLRGKGAVYYIVFSSVFFGVLHMANAFSGKDALSTVLQVINALLLGGVLALLIVTTEEILPLIAFHFIYDALALVSKENTEHEVLLVAILNVMYLLYGAYLIVNLLRRSRAAGSPEAKLTA